MPESRSEFVMVPNWLHGVVAVRCIGVYVGLRSYDVPGGCCSPSEATVAELLGVSASTVKRAVRDLRAVKAVRLRGQGRGSRNNYTFPARKGQSFSKVPIALLGQVPIGTVGVYSVLRSFDGAKGCYPAIATVAERVGLSHTATQDALRVLRSIGAIDVAARYKPGGAPTSNTYRFPDMIRQTPQPLQVDIGGVAGEHEWGHQPGVGEVMSRVPVGSAGGRELENLTRDSEKEMVSRCPPPAASQEPIREPGNTAKNPSDAPDQAGNPATGSTQNNMAPAGDSTDGNPWFHHPLTDSTLERLVWDLVDLLAEELALSGKNKPTEATRDVWARTARVMLAHEKHDYAKVSEIIRNACADNSWSKAINNMYDISQHWDRLVVTFTKRAPKRFKPRTDKIVREAGPPPMGFSHSASLFGVTSLSDLADSDFRTGHFQHSGRGLADSVLQPESDSVDGLPDSRLGAALSRRLREQRTHGPK